MRLKPSLLFAQLATLAACAQQAPAPATDAAAASALAPQQGTAQQAAAASAPGSASQRARVCESPRIGRHGTNNSPAIPMTVSNEGGWCRKGFTRNGGYPFTGGSIVNQPQHGEARIRHLARRTVVEYRPNPGYVGEDSFAAELTPGNGRYPVQVTVQP